MEQLKSYVRDLMMQEGISGYEGNAANVFLDIGKKNADEVCVDQIGNAIIKVKGTNRENPKKIMIFGHLDSLGLIVSKIDDSGFIFVDRLGGIPEKVLPGLRVKIRTVEKNYVPGIIAVKSHHATSADEKYKVDKVTEIYIDVGAKSKEEVLNVGIRVGCPMVYEPRYVELMGGRVSGTTVDNRAGCACMLRILDLISEQKPDVDVYVVGSVFEEFNLRGAIIAAREIKPDFAICIDVSLAGDTPETRGRFSGNMGEGPVVSLYNFHGRGTLNGNVAHEGLYQLARKCASEYDIPLQEFASTGMLTDSAYVQFEHKYIPCLDMGFPTRYTHSPIETFELSDLELLAQLVHKMLLNIDDNLKPSRF